MRILVSLLSCLLCGIVFADGNGSVPSAFSVPNEIVYYTQPKPKLNHLNDQIYSDLRVYGSDRVGLLRSPNHCHIVMRGKTRCGRVVAKMYWNPHRPNSIIILPAEASVPKVLNVLQNNDFFTTMTTINGGLAKLSFPDETIQMHGNQRMEDQFPLMWGELTIDPNSAFIDQVQVTLSSQHLRGEKGKVTFKLRGFSEAFANARCSCNYSQ